MLRRLLLIAVYFFAQSPISWAQNCGDNQKPMFDAKDIYKLDLYGQVLKQTDQEFVSEGYKRDIFKVEPLGLRPNFNEFYNVKIRMEYVAIGIGGASIRNIIEFFGYYTCDSSGTKRAELIGFDRMTIDRKENN